MGRRGLFPAGAGHGRDPHGQQRQCDALGERSVERPAGHCPRPQRHSVQLVQLSVQRRNDGVVDRESTASDDNFAGSGGGLFVPLPCQSALGDDGAQFEFSRGHATVPDDKIRAGAVTAQAERVEPEQRNVEQWTDDDGDVAADGRKSVAAVYAGDDDSDHHQNGLITSTASGLQIIGTSSTNGATAFPLPTSAVVTNGKELINGTTANGTTKNGLRTTTVSDAGGNKIEIIATQTTAGSGLEPPATKVIKLVNGNTLVGLTSMDKDKMMLSQVVQQGGIVVSPIQLLTSTQGLRVIQQAPNGLATIELSSPTNVQSQPSQVHRTTGGNNGIISSAIVPHNHNHQHLPSQTHQHHHQQQPHQQIQQVTGAQLHKLLLSSAAVTNGTPTTTTTINGGGGGTTPELARLPGGAELNILPAGSNGSTTTATLPLYRTTTVGGPQTQAGKLTFVNAIANGNGLTLKGTDVSGASRGAVHVVQSGQLSSLTPVVVSRYDHHLHHQDAVTTSLFTTAPASGKMGTLVSRN